MWFFLTGFGIPLAIASEAFTIGEVVVINILEDSLIKQKINTYKAKTKHFNRWLDKIYK
jgi:phosphopantetheine adenylyltransferase